MAKKASQQNVVGELPSTISQFIVPRLEAGDIMLEQHGPEIASFNLGRFGVPDVPERLSAKNARQKLAAFKKKCEKNLASVDKSELEAWLLSIGLLLAHLRDSNNAQGLQELLCMYEFAGECAQVLRYLRTGKVLANSPISAVDWFTGLVPSIPEGEGGHGFLSPPARSGGQGVTSDGGTRSIDNNPAC